MELRFSWDEQKAMANLRKHGVDFATAATIFGDSNSITIYDEAHSTAEDRFIMIGLAVIGQLLVTVYTERDQVIRIISCREATARERNTYEP